MFVDLWHDISDGTEMYIKMKKYEANLPKAKFSYWIEDSILSAIRVRLLDAMYKGIKENNLNKSIKDIELLLDDENIRKIVKIL